MKVLILGGTGTMGTQLVRMLLSENHEVTVTTRSYKESSSKNLFYVQGNAKNIDFIVKIMSSKWNVIIDFMSYKTNEFNQRVDYLLKSTEQYIFLSSARVYANLEKEIFESSNRLLETISNEYIKTDEYALAKARQEDILINSKYKNWTIIRPYITYGKDRMQLGEQEKESWLYRALNNKTIILSKDMLEKMTTLTYSFDVAVGIKKLLGEKEACQNIFNIANDNAIKWNEVLEIYFNAIEKYLGYRPKVILLELEEYLEITQARYQITYDRLYDRQFNNSKINEFVNTKQFKEPYLGLTDSIEEFLHKPFFKNINWKNEAICDRVTNEYTSLRKIKGIKQKIIYLMFRYVLNNGVIKWIKTIQQNKMYKY